MEELFANIIVDVRAEALNKSFVFKIGDDLKDKVKPGDRVIFPFGKGNNDREGYIIEILTLDKLKEKNFYKREPYFKEPDAIEKLKYIKGLVDKKIGATEILLKMAIYMAKEYYAPLALCLNACMPVKKQVRKNIRQVDAINKYNFDEKEKTEKNDIVLNEKQQEIFDKIKESLDKNTFNEHLICGITGSGKTEIYIKLIEDTIKKNKKAIVLIPEIALTHQTVVRLRQKFGDDVAIIHSRMSAGDKYIQYKKCEEGKANILVGPRSALFAPFTDLGLIVIDEVNDDSYKSDYTPRYETLDIARYRAKEQNATLVALSATPKVTHYYEAENGTDIMLHKLDRRAVSSLPEVTVVDMKEEYRKGNKSCFSKLLIDKINDRLSKHEQVMLFMNRRGYDTIYTCKSCGETIKCPHCDVALCSHNDGKLKCHYCGYEMDEPLNCPTCKSHEIEKYGLGTEKLEEMCIEQFPNARIIRMDRDTTKEKDSHDKIIEKFKNHEADILIGTQMIVKGHDFPLVTLVAVMRADLIQGESTYKASENLFSMLTQCVGRSGRKESGESIIQAYDTENFAIEMAKAHDYDSYYKKEISYREKLSYPPFSRLLYIKLSCIDENKIYEAAKNLKLMLDTKNEVDAVILGPTKASPYKVKDSYMYNIYVKAKNINDAKFFRRLSQKFIDYMDKDNAIKIIFDIE